jgi:WD40 repeat protein
MRYLRVWLLLAAGISLAAAQPDDRPSAASGRADCYGDPLPAGAVARLGTLRWRLEREANTLVGFSADGRRLITADGFLGLTTWDRSNGTVVSRTPSNPSLLDDPNGQSQCMALSTNGRTLVAGAADGAVIVLDVETGAHRRLTGHEGAVQVLALSADGRVASSRAADQSIRTWDVVTGRERARLPLAPTHNPQGPLALSADGRTLAWAGGNDQDVHVCDADSGVERRRITGQQLWVQDVALAPDGKMLVVTTQDGQVKLHDVASGRQLHQLRPSRPMAPAMYVLFSPDGKRLITAGYAPPVRVWDVATGAELCEIRVFSGLRQALAFAPDGKTLAAVNGQFSPAIRLFDATTGAEVMGPAGHRAPVAAVAFADAGRTVVTAAGRGLMAWDVARAEPLRTIGDGPGWSSWALSADGRRAAVLERGAIRIHDLVLGKDLCRIEPQGGRPGTLALAPDGSVLAGTAQDAWIVLWDTTTGKEVRRLPWRAQRYGASLLFSPDGRMLVAAAHLPAWQNGMLTSQPGMHLDCWDPASGRLIRSLGVLSASGDMAFTPDGRTLAIGTSNGEALDFWEVATGRVRLTIPQPHYVQRFFNGEHMVEMQANAQVGALSFAPDGSMFALANHEESQQNRQGHFRLLDAHTGAVLADHHGQRGRVTSFGFSADGARLASGSWDTTALIWDVGRLLPARPAVTEQPAADALEAWWVELGSPDATKAYQALAHLVALPDAAVALLGRHLAPAPPADVRHLHRLLAELDDEQFAVRERATAELIRLDHLAEPLLRSALARQPSSEARWRIDGIVEKLAAPLTIPGQLQAIRGVEVLEHLATPDARWLLESLARGTPEARQTQEAKASLQRLARRPAQAGKQ